MHNVHVHTSPAECELGNLCWPSNSNMCYVMYAHTHSQFQFTFCRLCKSAYHDGPCRQVQRPAQEQAQQNGQVQPNPAQLQRAGWIEANERFIQDNTNIKQCPRCKIPIEKSGEYESKLFDLIEEFWI